MVSYVLGPLVFLKSDDDMLPDAASPHWQYYLLGQALLSFFVFLVTVLGEQVNLEQSNSCLL